MNSPVESRQDDAGLLRGFLPYLTVQARRVAAAYSASAAGVLLTLLLPWPLKFIIDGVLGQHGELPLLAALTATQQLLVLAGSMGLLAALAATVQSIDKVMHARVREEFSYRLRDDLVQKVYRLSRVARQSEMSGELTMRLVSDTQLVTRLFCKTLPLALHHTLIAVTTLISITLISVSIGIASLIMTTLLSFLVMSHGPRLAKAAAAKRCLEGNVSARTQQTISGIEHIQAMALEEQSRSHYLQGASASLRAGVDEIRVAVRLERSAKILAGLSLALVTAIGGLAVIDGLLTLGELTVCLSYLTQLLKPIEGINDIATAFSRGLARAARIRCLLRADVTPESDSGDILPEPVQRIDCRGVYYRYPNGDENVVSAFTHSFRVGECTSIIGPSGCGKSTLLRLILGLQAPTSGTICANARNYSSLNRRAMRTQFAVLMQDSHLFAGTIREIVTEASASASDESIQDVLRNVHLWQFVDSLPLRLETPIDELGMRLSVGQRARLFLARAILSRRPVLLLDEPFANFDDESRLIILRCLAGIKRDRILIIVTHERSLLGLSDHVLTTREFRADDDVSDPDSRYDAVATAGPNHATA